ncbi:tyrosine-type recombinase/integrase [uncultured Deinococcus sp.]|uniref:tyrosine-type recombinase/integrase n=1 Tax=uncultured Deinococcus sp. TaxID=158789 RepID=UPI0025DD5226|nr:tyrosine-type recombinase/integrase [uncultured Deinococcus sp.]
MTMELYRHGQLAPSREWVALHPEERRRRAVAAVTDHDLVTLLDLLTAHHVRTHGHVSEETLRKYRLGARVWLTAAWNGAINVLHPEAEDTDLWVRHLEAEGKSPASVGVLLAGARALYAALRWTKATKDTPFNDVRPKKDRRRPWDKRQPYPDADVQRLLDVAPVEMRVLLRLGGIAGLRASEITTLKWGDVDLDGGALTVMNGKGGKTRRVLLSASLIDDLQTLGVQDGALPVIGRTPEAARARLRTLCIKTSIPYLGLHALRHTAGTRLMRAGFQLQDVAEHLGHSDVQTARTYGKWADDRLKAHLRSQ